MKNEIAIIDYGAGNLGSLINALKYLDYSVEIINKPSKKKFSHIILPGVGAFGKLARNLVKTGFKEFLLNMNEKNVKILGICVGMQLLFEASDEGGDQKGLELINGKFEKFEFKENSILPLPHVGFSKVYQIKSHIWNEIPDKSYFYFIHTFRLKNILNEFVSGNSNYGENFISTIKKKNIFGCQFHPEKSHNVGLKFLDNFLKF